MTNMVSKRGFVVGLAVTAASAGATEAQVHDAITHELPSGDRPRSILHVVMGDDNWDPTISEMEEMAQLVGDALKDPKGATLVTRKGVEMRTVYL